MTDDHPLGTAMSQPVAGVLRDAVTGLRDCGAVVVAGFPASGKSTAAAYLAEVLGAPVLDKDRFAPLLEESVMQKLTGDPYDRDSETYRTLVGPGVYDGIIRTGLTVAATHPVVLDAPFLSTIRQAAAREMSLSDHLRDYTGLAESVPLVTIWLDAAAPLIRARMIARGAERDAPKLADWETYRTEVLDSGVRDLAHTFCDHVITTSPTD
ncbi:ATP-binding protein [Nocardia abscessus]|uniref:ATP-binding protein n=1 Tax=Nocardia abscessus TaxID=120957 RepID=A0ABS0CBA1_9NOCA|nr:AAA family ATPase [Nocardia abscessus]MBF6227126.1 ATP-binding protein [Nocardia abscessus]